MGEVVTFKSTKQKDTDKFVVTLDLYMDENNEVSFVARDAVDHGLDEKSFFNFLSDALVDAAWAANNDGGGKMLVVHIHLHGKS